MDNFTIRPYELVNTIQHYVWGTRNETSFIPQLLGIPIIPDKPYAELWIGVHPKAPSMIKVDNTQVSLPDFIANFPVQILGNLTYSLNPCQLPFLLKILSAGEALSIQVHPNKVQAETLHTNDPQHYPDSNPKPEIAIALDSLEALIGFRSFPEWWNFLLQYPEVAIFVGKDILEQKPRNAETMLRWQKDFFTRLMNRSLTHKHKMPQMFDGIEMKIRHMSSPINKYEKLFLELRQQYGDDIGLSLIFLLNIIHLQSGEGVFIPTGTPHAYLKGNIIECMTNSDNVIRAGLTKKFTDIPNLLEVTTFTNAKVDILSAKENTGEIRYPTPTSEFFLSRLKGKTGNSHTEEIKNGVILLIIKGEIVIRWLDQVKGFRQGQAILIPAAIQSLNLEFITSGELYKAAIPSSQTRNENV